MQHFRVSLEIGKKKNNSRTLYVRAKTIADAYVIGNKVRYARIVNVQTISFEDYMLGVDKKYKKPEW